MKTCIFRTSVGEKVATCLVLFAIVIGSVLGSTNVGYAQNGPPSNIAIDVPPGTTITTLPSGATVAVVEGRAAGLGTNVCPIFATTDAQVEQTTVNLLNQGIPTITEISPQQGCDGKVSDWEDRIALITDKIYYQSHVAASIIPYYWYGIMLDEEYDYWPTGGVQAYDTINEATNHLMAHLPGVAYFYTEDFAIGQQGAWTQDQYNKIVRGESFSIPSPQVYNSNMVGYANSEQAKYNDSQFVTWDCHASDSDYPTAALATSKINGPPYVDPADVSLSNEYTGGQSC